MEILTSRNILVDPRLFLRLSRIRCIISAHKKLNGDYSDFGGKQRAALACVESTFAANALMEGREGGYTNFRQMHRPKLSERKKIGLVGTLLRYIFSHLAGKRSLIRRD